MGSHKHHIVIRENGVKLFEPDRLNANIGDRIIFYFRSLNYTLTESSLETPYVSAHQFDTGFHQFNLAGSQDLTLILTINRLTPLWYFCKQPSPLSYCHDRIVFAINPGEYINKFRQNTKRSTVLSSSVQGTPRPTHSIPTGLLELISLPIRSKTPSATQSIVVLTKTIATNCQTGIMAVETQASPIVKRNVSRSSAAESLSPTIWGRIGIVALGHLIFMVS